MSNKSGTSSQIISLPKGGGALQGIGEKFSPDLFTGTGNFTVPIAVPPGRNGFQPELNLVYSTGNGNGPFGLGWGLSIPGVSRKISKGVPRYDDSKDVFILSGAEDLVPVSESVEESTEQIRHRTRYRPRTEGLFAQIEHHRIINRDQRTVESDYWEVRSKDGLVSFYGTDPRDRPADADQDWQDPAVVADPSNPDNIFSWQLTKTEDAFGNRIVYEYKRDSDETPEHHWDQLYLKRIQYVDYTNDDGREQFLVSVTFDYSPPDEESPDPFSDYRAGFEIRTRKRCKRIEIRTHADEERLVRTYDLVYLDQRDDLENLEHLLPLNGVSLLSQIKVTGHDGDATEELPPLEFGYTRFEPEGRDFFPLEGHLAARSLASPDLELADLFGNGLPDVLEINGTVRYWRNLGSGRFDLSRQMQYAPAGLSLADPGVQLIDADGDGRIDLLATINGLSGYFPLRFGGLWDRRSFQRYDLAPSFNLEDPEVRLVDLTGDGVTDAIRSGSRLECFFNDPKEGWNGSRWVERQTLEEFPNINFSDSRVKWGDMSGDGLQDIVLVYDGNVEYWPNLGYGNWAKRISMRNSPRFPYGYDPKRILVGDVDGDGLADIVYVDDTKVTLWINQSGNGWSDPIEIQGTPPVSDMDAVRLADMLGTGIGGVLWSADAGVLARENMFFLDFTGGIKPYLLNEMNNYMGAITRVEYAPSTRFYLEDEKRPETRWKTPLPFPVHVVGRVEVIDEISKGKLTTEYRYHHGYWDGAEREFRGFGRVDQRDTEVFERYHASGLHPDRTFESVQPKQFSPPLETRTWFHQGPIGDEFGEWEETDFTSEFWGGDPQLLVRSPEMVEFLRDLPRRARRDALRTLRGSILRTELYALDGTERQDRPYTVTENLYGVREVDPPGSGEEGRPRVFFSHALAQRTTQWERGDDPMTQFSFTEDYDEYGQPEKEIRIACPRGWRTLSDIPGEPYLATISITAHASSVHPQVYIVDRVARATTYEITNDGATRMLDLKDIPEDSNALQIIGQTLNFYDGQPFTGRAVGQVGKYGALVRTETLVLTQEILEEAYRVGNTVQIPPYLEASGTVAWTDEYPEEFRKLLPSQQPSDDTRPRLHITPAGYGFTPGETDSPYEAGYFAATERHRYDFHDDPAGKGRGLQYVARDAVGQDTRIEYDAYDLLPIKVIDPTKLVTETTYDYRIFQPRQVTDPNGNRTTYGFTPLGLPERTAIMGKAGEQLGDTLDAPGTQRTYDFLAFYQRRQPISVRTSRRVHHVCDGDVDPSERGETLDTVEYSDGFGRLLQTRTQAEDIAFGQPVFGGNLLPVDQRDRAGTSAGVVGRERADSDPPNVVVSGWQVYDNKGQVVEQYEPFFSSGWDYAPQTEFERGQKSRTHYDPLGRVVRSVAPDGSEELVIFGKPADLANPVLFTPTPWEIYTYDANDNSGRTHHNTSQDYAHHRNTPSSDLADALGRTIAATQRNGPDAAADWYVTHFEYDARDNVVEVVDGLGRSSVRYVYDLEPAQEGREEVSPPLRTEFLDGGIRRVVFDAAGSEIERRDSKGGLTLQTYDALGRQVRFWARDRQGERVTLRERLVYGDGEDAGLTRDAARAANLLGGLYLYCDEAGLLTYKAYDFKGNLLERERRVVRAERIQSVFEPQPANWEVQPFRVDWQPPPGTTWAEHAAKLLDGTCYQVSRRYDALDRPKEVHYPEDVDGKRKVLKPVYNRAGGLERVELDGVPYVRHIAYDAKGQRTLIAYGNGVMTRCAYDPQTFRLARLRSERHTNSTPLTYRPTGRPLQDTAYTYDRTGNILSMVDRTPGSGVKDNPQVARVADPELAALVAAGDALVRWFTYDPLYHLTSATGRECKNIPRPRAWTDDPRCGFGSGNHGTANQDNAPNLTTVYQEDYTYDPVGNMLFMRHRNNGNPWTRYFGMGGLTPAQWRAEWPVHLGAAEWTNPPTNRLTHVGDDDPATPQTHYYDANGNMTRETTSRHFEWDHSDQMRAFRVQTPGAEPSVYAHYLYDSDGRRVMKAVRKRGRLEITVYIERLFEHHRLIQPSGAAANNTLHVMDNETRIATVRVGDPFPDDGSPSTKYFLGDHLDSSGVAVSADGGWINREEYAPYGETSFGGYARKRYRFTGKERDEESGLAYHGARYISPGICRWVSVDPIQAVNPYEYAGSNPMGWRDDTGLFPNEQRYSGWWDPGGGRLEVDTIGMRQAITFGESRAPPAPEKAHPKPSRGSKSRPYQADPSFLLLLYSRLLMLKAACPPSSSYDPPPQQLAGDPSFYRQRSYPQWRRDTGRGLPIDYYQKRAEAMLGGIAAAPFALIGHVMLEFGMTAAEITAMVWVARAAQSPKAVMTLRILMMLFGEAFPIGSTPEDSGANQRKSIQEAKGSAEAAQKVKNKGVGGKGGKPPAQKSKVKKPPKQSWFKPLVKKTVKTAARVLRKGR